MIWYRPFFILSLSDFSPTFSSPIGMLASNVALAPHRIRRAVFAAAIAKTTPSENSSLESIRRLG